MGKNEVKKLEAGDFEQLGLRGFNNGGLEWEKKRCIQCRSSRIHLHGRSRCGRQRWRCYQCRKTFSWSNSPNRRWRQQIWFRRWIAEGYTLRQLAAQSGYSVSTIRRIIAYWLSRPPEPRNDLSGCEHLILDGTALERRRGLFAVMNGEGFNVLYGRVNMAEGPRDLGGFCDFLNERRLQPKSATVDGNPHLIRTLKARWPQIKIQRCLVHIQRQGLIWCRYRPKRTDAKHLRRLFLKVLAIRTQKDKRQFIDDVAQWERRYGSIAHLPESGWVFSDLKRARSLLLAALPDMFHHLNNKNISRSTNALEGYFGRLKQRYRQHRGLATHRRAAYFSWYLHLCPR